MLDQTIFGEILKQGLLGILLIGSILLNLKVLGWYRDAEEKNDKLQEKRVEEGLANFKIISELTQAVKDLTSARRR
jgi:hypothetical protein